MKKYIFAGIVYFVIVGLIWYIAVMNFPKKKSKDEIFFEKIELLSSKIDSLAAKKDSIRTIIITVEKEIVSNEKHYEEVINNIISQPHYDDSVYISNYIKRYVDERFSDK